MSYFGCHLNVVLLTNFDQKVVLAIIQIMEASVDLMAMPVLYQYRHFCACSKGAKHQSDVVRVSAQEIT